MMAARVTPRQDAGDVPAPVLRPLADLVESGVLDQCFEWGMIVSSFPPMLLSSPAGLEASGSELINLVYQAKQADAEWLVVVSMETGALPVSGAPEIIGLRLEVHDLGDGEVRSMSIPCRNSRPQDLGREIGLRLQAFL